MAPKLPRVRSHYGCWKRPLTSIYNDNYLFGFNFYDDLMIWLEKRDVGVDPGPVVHLPSVPETHFKKFARDRDEHQNRKDEDAAIRRTRMRIEKMAPRPHNLRSEREDLNRDLATQELLRRSTSYSNFSKTTPADAIESELRRRAASANAFFRKPLRTERDYENFLKGIDRRRNRRILDAEFEETYLDSPRRSRFDNFDYDVARRREEMQLDEKIRRSGSVPRDIFSSRDSYAFRRFRNDSPARECPARDLYLRSSASNQQSREVTYSATMDKYRHTMDSGFSSAPGSRAGSPIRAITAMDDITGPSSWELRCKQMQSEIEQLNARLMDAESKLKTDVPREKKRYINQIEDLEKKLQDATTTRSESYSKRSGRKHLMLTEASF